MRRPALGGLVALCLAAVAAPASAAPGAKGKPAKPGKVATGPAPGAPGKGRSAVVPKPGGGNQKPKTPAELKAEAAKKAAAEMARLPPELRDVMREVNSFEKQAAEYRQEVQLLVERKYKRKRASLAASYEKAIENLEVLERKDRLDAIAQFEEFLSRYPHEADYTPAAMMRLAELYYEKTEDEYQIAEKAYYKKLDSLPADQRSKVAPLPPKRYEKPIALYQKVITEFPRYQYVDGAYYLLGYLLGEQDEHDAELATFHTLVTKFPKSKFVPEVWLRIGEFYFDADQSVYPGALQKAIAAYKKVLPYKHHPLYDKVLYKLGWTYYRVNDFQDAVNTFSDLLAFYQAKAKKEGEKKVGGDLRAEAIQYTAISFADDKWGSFEKAKQFFADRGHPPYELVVMRRLGDVYYDLTKTDAAVSTYRYVLSRYPDSDDAPAIQKKIVAAYTRNREFQKAFAAQEVLVKNYSVGTPWYRKHQNDPKVVAQARKLTEDSLRASAVFHHKQAQEYRQEGKVELAFSEYKLAASAYGQYLKLYPDAKDRYDFEYYYADTLYNSAQFQAAAKYFGLVRDSNVDNTYLEDSALGAVLSWDKEIQGEEAAGKLTKRPVVTSKNWPADKKVVAEKIPKVELSYVAAADAYVKRLPHGDRAPNVAYKAGEVFYVYGHHAEARKRFEQVVERWPKAEAAQYAANLIIETYLIAKNWKAVEETSAKLLSSAAIKNAGGQVAATFNQFKLGGRFKRAQQLFDAGSYEKAAALYLKLVKEAPHYKYADKAVYNAAVCYEKVLRFESALKLYQKVYQDYPKSALADQALFLVAYNAERAFDYDKAVERYLYLVQDYPQSQQRQGALQNAAILLYLTQHYARAAKQFERYARMYPKADQTPRLLLLAAESREKQGDPRGAIQAYQEFIRRYRHETASASKVVDAELKTAKAYESLHESRRAQAAYHATVKLFDALQPKLKGDDKALAAASDHAAEAQFMIAEAAFKTYDAIKIVAHGRGKRFQRSLKHVIDVKKTEAKKVSDLYKQIYQYGRLEWTLAAAYRLGYVLDRFANALLEAPVPHELKRLGDEYVYAYQDQLSQIAFPIQDQAVKAYAVAAKKAKEAGIVNKWTKLTLESLNRYAPDKWPILKEARDKLVAAPLSPRPLAPTPAGIPRAKPQGTRLGGGPGGAAGAVAPQAPAPAGGTAATTAKQKAPAADGGGQRLGANDK